VPLADWRAYLTARAIDRHASLLPKAFADEHFAVYQTELRGVPTQPPRWRRAIDVMNGVLPEQVGREYVKHWFAPESKQAIERMVAGIVAAFSRRIDALSWMSDATKAKAKEKLETLRVGIGYPDAWTDDSTLTASRSDAYGNVERAEAWDSHRRLASIGQPLDRGHWEMPAQVVNAQNLPIRNALSFPAGILVAPFFDPTASPAANYGSIGAVIGHEISHSFDDEGAKFDAHGRFVNWWTPDDHAHFEASAAALAAQFSTYKPFDDASVDGKLTLSENLADLAGLAAAYDAWRASLAGAPAPVQDGLTGDQQFFLGFAQTWQEKFRDATARLRLKTDAHAPPRYRSLTVRNLDAWYSAFDVQRGDALFLPPGERVRVW
jgi:predicted metalloendopeptidase